MDLDHFAPGYEAADEHPTVQFLFCEIGLQKTTMCFKKRGNSHGIQIPPSACGSVKARGDIRSGGLKRFLLCAGANQNSLVLTGFSSRETGLLGRA